MDGSVSAKHTHSLSASEAMSPRGNSQGSLEPHKRKIWAVGGGKGGVGKSLIASSLAISLARTGHQVTAIDLDLGGANLHTALGIELPKQCLSDYLGHRVPNLAGCAAPTGIPNLSLISGSQDSLTVPQISEEQKAELLEQIQQLNSDFIILDLGAGTSMNTLDFFLSADLGWITVLPEPTSIENAYRFIKGIYFRHLQGVAGLFPVRDLIVAAMDPKNPLGIRSPSDLIKEIQRSHPELVPVLRAQVETFKPKLVMNQTRTQTDVEIGQSIKIVCKKYFGIDLDFAGFLEYDSSVWQAVRKKRPLLLEFPNSKIVYGIEQMIQKVLLER